MASSLPVSADDGIGTPSSQVPDEKHLDTEEAAWPSTETSSDSGRDPEAETKALKK